jgi:holo-[acyl-carrier protein] synthase
MIIGVGTDILKISRIDNIFNRYGDRFSKRILCHAELNIFENKNKSISFLAKRFSVKEAASKALGTGIGAISWHDFEVKNDSFGAPILKLTGGAKKKMEEIGASQALISLSDESDHVLSFVVIF